MVSEKLKKNIAERSIWLRGLYMLLFGFIYSVAEFVTVAVVLLQFGIRLITGRLNPQLLGLGQSLSVFIYQIWRFLTFNSEELPFPFTRWPSSEPDPNQDLLDKRRD